MQLAECALLFRCCKFLCPVLGFLDGSILILLPVLCNVVCKRIVRVRSTEQCLDRKKDGANLQSGRPIV